MTHARSDITYPILTKQIKLQHEEKPILNLKSIESVGFQQTFTKFIDIFFSQN